MCLAFRDVQMDLLLYSLLHILYSSGFQPFACSDPFYNLILPKDLLPKISS